MGSDCGEDAGLVTQKLTSDFPEGQTYNTTTPHDFSYRYSFEVSEIFSINLSQFQYNQI